MRNLKKEMLEIKGGEFINWYKSLTKLEKIEYSEILNEIGKK